MLRSEWSSNFFLRQSFFPNHEDRCMYTNYKLYPNCFHVPQLLQLSSKMHILICLCFQSVISGNDKIYKMTNYFQFWNQHFVLSFNQDCAIRFRRILWVSLTQTDSGLCICHFLIRSNFSLLHNSAWIRIPTQSYLLVYSFCVSQLHWLIMWLFTFFLLVMYIAQLAGGGL